MNPAIIKALRPSRRPHASAISLAIAAQLVAFPAFAQSSTSGSQAVNLNIPNGAAVPSAVSPTAAGNVPAKTTAGTSAEDAKIDALRPRGVVTEPSVTDTITGNIGGWRSTLANDGIGVNGVLSPSFAVNTLDEPQETDGTHRYVGQEPEFDISNSYLALTYDLGRIGMTGGLATVQACGSASTAKTYPHGIRICTAYIDQPFFNHHFDIQIGYLANNFQFVNPFVGGSIASGSLGPSASILSEVGLSANGVGAPGVNLTASDGNFYDRFGVQRSVFVDGLLNEAQVANPYGVRFSEPGEGVLYINEFGYRQLPAPGKLSTWIRLGPMLNTSEYTSYKVTGAKERNSGMYALADHQFIQIDPSMPRRGLYAGASYMRANPDVNTYSNYYEARVYGIGLIPSRPTDQIAFVANMTTVSPSYRNYLASKHYESTPEIMNLTLDYTYHVGAGVYLTTGLAYSIHPSPYFNDEQGNPLLFRCVLVMYL